jgi:hypothetical protein
MPRMWVDRGKKEVRPAEPACHSIEPQNPGPVSVHAPWGGMGPTPDHHPDRQNSSPCSQQAGPGMCVSRRSRRTACASPRASAAASRSAAASSRAPRHGKITPSENRYSRSSCSACSPIFGSRCSNAVRRARATYTPAVPTSRRGGARHVPRDDELVHGDLLGEKVTGTGAVNDLRLRCENDASASSVPSSAVQDRAIRWMDTRGRRITAPPPAGGTHWEGVTNYLTDEAVDATLRYVSTVAAGNKGYTATQHDERGEVRDAGAPEDRPVSEEHCGGGCTPGQVHSHRRTNEGQPPIRRRLESDW